MADGNDLSINVNDTIENFILSYEKRFRLTPKLLGLTIEDFVVIDNFNVVRP